MVRESESQLAKSEVGAAYLSTLPNKLGKDVSETLQRIRQRRKEAHRRWKGRGS